MKVAIYAGMFKRNQDGATRSLYELVDSLLQQDINVGVWAFTITPQEKKGLQLFTIPSLPLPFYPEYKISLPNAEVKQQMDEFAPDVIHITVPDLMGVSLMRYAKKRGIPVLTSYHTDFPSYLKSYGLSMFYKPAWHFFRWFYNRSDIVMAPTMEMIDKLKSHGIENVKLWSRGIHLEYFNEKLRCENLRKKWGATGKRVILFSGRFVWYKDLRTFIDVYNLFKKDKKQQVKFVLAGDGPIRNELEQSMPDAHFTGYLDVKELASVYASSDLFLFPSTTETFGNVVLEALSSGLPAVVSDEGGCKEIVERADGGMVVKAKDAHGFYIGCKQLLENHTLYRHFQANGLNYAHRQDWQEINQRVIKEYRTIAGFKPNTQKRKSAVLVGNGLSSKENTRAAMAG